MKNKVSWVLCAVLLFSLTACGGDEKGEKSTENKVYTLKWAHSSPAEKDRLGDASIKMIADIATASNGRLKFEYYPASQLGAERDTLEGVSLGTVDFAVISTGPILGFFPEIAVTSIPYLISNREAAWAVYDGPFGQKLSAMMEKKTGMKVLGWAENGFRTFSNNKREIQRPEDMKGLKIRSMENDVHMEIISALGASAIPVSFAELYTALQQGTVDGQENGLALTYNNKLYEHLGYLTLDYHVYDPFVVVMSGEAWNSLPADLQALMTQKAKEFIDLERKYSVRDVEYCQQAMVDAGIKIYQPTEEDLQAFRNATAGIIDIIRTRVGDELVDEFINSVKEARK